MIDLIFGFTALALMLVLVSQRLPRVQSAAGDLRLHRVADDVYFYRGYFSNSAVLVLGDGVLLVDTQVSPRAAERLREEIAKITDKPVRWVINTHYHGDHTGGNALFPEAEIIATSLCARYVVERDAERLEYAHTFGLEFHHVHETVGPTRTFDGALELELGGERIEVRQIGRGETPDACVVWWPRRGVCACGDAVATVDYPYLGVPFMDEGLRDDGEWVGLLRTVKSWQPHILLPGHGPPMIGGDRIGLRLELLASLFEDLLRVTREEMKRGGELAALVERVEGRLERYGKHPDLQQYTVSQRFAIYRAFNNLSPDRKGKGWWHDLRPSVIRRAEGVTSEGLSSGALIAEVERVVDSDRPRAIALLESHLSSTPTDAAAWGLLADVFFDGARSVRPTVDATEYFVASTKAAKKALALDPEEPLALLNLGCAEVFGAMVLAQTMSPGIDKIERSLAARPQVGRRSGKAEFFLGKAHQMELRTRESDRHLRRALPLALRPLFPLLRPVLRAFP